MKNLFLAIVLGALSPLQVLAQAPEAAPQTAVAQEPENALKYLQQARAALKPYAYTEKNGKLEPPSGADARRVVEENAAVFSLLERAVSLPLRFEYEGQDPTSSLFKVMSGTREMARLLALRTQVQDEAGDAAGALRSTLLCVDLGLKLQEDGGMLPSLTGYAVEAIGLGALEKLAPKWDAATLKDAARKLGQAEAKRPVFSLMLASDREVSLAQMRAMFQATALTEEGVDQPTQDRLLAALRQVSEQDDLLFERPFALMRGLDFEDAEEDEEEDEPQWMPEVGAKLDAEAWAEAIQKTVRPIKHSALFNRTRAQTRIALLQAALAARAFQIEHKTPPASLQVLVPNYLSAAPADPFELGAPLQFKNDADGLRIYSVGPDGLDDGGQPMRNFGDDGQLIEGQKATNKNFGKDSQGDILASPELLKP